MRLILWLVAVLMMAGCGGSVGVAPLRAAGMAATPLPGPSPYPGGSAIARLPDGSLLYSTGIVGPSMGEGAYPLRGNGTTLSLVQIGPDRIVACGRDSMRGRGLSEPVGRLTCKTVRDGVVENSFQQGGFARFLKPHDMLADSSGIRVLAIRSNGVPTVIEARRGGRSWALDRIRRPVAGLLLPSNRAMVLYQTRAGCEWRHYRLADDGGVSLLSRRRETGRICGGFNSRTIRDVSTLEPYVLSVSNRQAELTAVADDGTVSTIPFAPKPLRIVPSYIAAVDGQLYFDDGSDPSFRRVIGAVNVADGSYREIVLPDGEIYRRQRGLMADPAGGVWAMFLFDDWMTIRLATESPAPGER